MSLVLSPVLGRLGGVGVEETPVSVTGAVGNGVDHVLHTVDVPPGSRVLVVIHGEVTAGTTNTSMTPMLKIGASTSVPWTTGPASHVAVVTGPTVVALRTRASISSISTSFIGTVYAAPL